VLTDIYEAEIEIQDCAHLIDFTKCSYSIEEQEKVHFIVEDAEKKTKLIQYSILEEKEGQAAGFHCIKVEKTHEVVLENITPLRVF
jgi:hypothetical protein